ncbi:hypothetical protein Srot_0641 [Segniliparus rotundus DSM 44985]|uniref:Uncharacterized protein n=1 Tax=Segniliparus rotundus (strain ATCC BAA-972 / CDC 1076 / CIP 108378 / DSM 44985 / JCM 13578) TaxID=640132 RepID=D6ZCT1_SEGRD|nr:hypothetical protein [Segniliparus rotundus]ADG97123.1 hypothetical protein Srot_0641 [Segniliparus rotundus DSM 44985]
MSLRSKLLPVSWAAATWSLPAATFATMPLGVFFAKAQGQHSNTALAYAAVFLALLLAALVVGFRVKTPLAKGAALGAVGFPIALILALSELKRNRTGPQNVAPNAAYGPESYVALIIATAITSAVGVLARPPLYGWALVLALILGGVAISTTGATRRVGTGILAAVALAFLLKCAVAVCLWLFHITT